MQEEKNDKPQAYQHNYESESNKARMTQIRCIIGEKVVVQRDNAFIWEKRS